MGHRTSRRAPAELAGGTWDLVVIGAGLTGSAIARDAARRGLRTVLVERDRIGGGAAGAWHGLLTDDGHADDPLRTTRLLRRERVRLSDAAPHLVRPLSLVAPDWQADRWPRRRRLVSLLLAELGGPDGNLQSVANWNKRAVLRAEPALRARGLTGGLSVARWMTNGATLARSMARSAALAGAGVATHTEAETLLYADGRLAGVRVVDRLDGSSHDLFATAIVFAGGAAAVPGEPAAATGASWRRVALLQQRVGLESSVVFTSLLDGTPLLLRRDGAIIHAAPLAAGGGVADGKSWVTALLRGINAAFPTARLSHGDVLGAREAPTSAAGAAPHVREDGLVLVTGGSPPLCRHVAESVVGGIVRLVQERSRSVPHPAAISSDHDPLPGGDAHDLAPIASLGAELGLSAEIIAHCLTTYGTEAAGVFNCVQREQTLRARLHPDAPAIAAEVAYAVRRGFAVTMADVLDGTLGMDLGTRDGGAGAAAACAAHLGAELGWSDLRISEAAAAHVAATARAASAIAALGA